MSDIWVVIGATALVIAAGLFSAADAALVGFSQARAEELRVEGKTGAVRLLQVIGDPPRFLNTVLLLRLLCEIGATVLVALAFHDLYEGSWWPTALSSLGVMAIVSFVAIGVAPRTIGRQHNERVALLTAGPITAITAVLGPIPRLLILVGNALTPGKGFREGPFQLTAGGETVLREMVDFAEASSIIEGDERRMIHSEIGRAHV
jgi:CBS domain containing-hemolysin-like protein